MIALQWIGIILACAGYIAGLRRWVYHGHLGLGLFSTLLCFPILISLTMTFPAVFLRAIPLAGIAMFIDHYRSRILMQIKLLWFTTLSVLVVQGYYAFHAFFVLAR